MKKILIVVDMQNDFINGALGILEAVAIVPKVRKKILTRKAEGYEGLFTYDTHDKNYLETNEGRHLPVKHCIIGTEGWKLHRDMDIQMNGFIRKSTFGYLDWNLGDDVEIIELVGLCTDICVVTNALILKTKYPEAEVVVDASCCAGVTPETHKAALETMKMCQINVIGE